MATGSVKRDRFYLIELAVALLMLLMLVTPIFDSYAYFSGFLLSMHVLYAILIIIMMAAYSMRGSNLASSGYAYAYHALFVLSVAVFVLSIVGVMSLALQLLEQTATSFVEDYIDLPIVPIVMLLASAGAYLISRKKKLLGCLLLVAVFVVLITFLFFCSPKGYRISDEEVLAFYGGQLLSQGHNPYNYSISNVIYKLELNGNISAAITTTNEFVGTMVYPSLFFISSIPFYLISQGQLQNQMTIGELLQDSTLLTLLVAVLVLVRKERDPFKPKFILIFFLALLIPSISASSDFLIALVLILAYELIDKEYAWVILGVAASLQQELWFPVILLLIYSFNNYGLKKGARLMIGTVLVFLAVNSYFIIINPGAFFGSIFSPALGYTFPDISSPIGYYMLTTLHVAINSLSGLYVMAMLVLAILFAVLNKKQVIGLFCIIPYFFLSHALPIYYTLPALLFAFSVYSNVPKEGEGRIMSYLGKRSGLGFLPALSIFLICILAVAVLYYSHLSYLNSFDISVANQSLSFNGNITTYSSVITYHEPVVNAIYVGILGGSYSVVGLYGFSVEQILTSNQTKCNESACSVNVNRIDLNSENSTYRVVAVIRSDTHGPVNYTEAFVYNGPYLYVSNVTYDPNGS
jgi:hypothetical protein